jgi:hypothetical protein
VYVNYASVVLKVELRTSGKPHREEIFPRCAKIQLSDFNVGVSLMCSLLASTDSRCWMVVGGADGSGCLRDFGTCACDKPVSRP